MRILYSFENKLLVKDNVIKTDVCSKAWYRYDIYDRSRPPQALFPDGTLQALDLGNNLFGLSSFQVVSGLRIENNVPVFDTEQIDIINIDTCDCNTDCVFVAIYNVFGLDTVSSTAFEIENGGIESFGQFVYSLMQYANIRVKCSVLFKDTEHSKAWRNSIGAFRKATIYYNGKELEGYIDFSTLVFNDNNSNCNFDVVAKLF